MKKLIVVFLVASGLAVEAGQFQSFSFLNPNVTSLLVSNNIGATNMTSQVLSLGGHYWTNIIGAGSYFAYTNGQGGTYAVSNNMYGPGGIMITQYSALLPGLLVLDTKTNITSTWSISGTTGVTAKTNDFQNMFQDVPLFSDATMSMQPLNLSTSTNRAATISITSLGDMALTSTAGPGAGSNIVNVVFVPVPDGVNESTATADAFTVTYTNMPANVSVANVPKYYLPQTYTTPLPSSIFSQVKAVRLKAIYTGNSTNGIWITSVTLNGWVP